MRMRHGWESQAKNWGRFARTPHHDHTHEDLNLPALMNLLPSPAGLTLDLGCGEGRIGRSLQSLGHTVIGIDAAPTMVQLARTHETPQLAILGDGAALPFPDETFNLVVAYMSLHDFDAMPQAVAEAARVLTPGGRLCAAIPHPINSAGSFHSHDPDAPFVIKGSYFDSSPVTWTATRDDIEVTFHSEHRPIHIYSRAMESAGLVIEAIREISPEDNATAPRQRWHRIPLFLHIKAMKLP